MNRTFTFLWVLFISVTLSAQKSTADYPKSPESPAIRFQKQFIKQLEKPIRLDKQEAAETPDLGFHRESGIPLADLANTQAARSGSAAAKQRLDSIVSAKSKSVFTYDEDGNITSAVYYKRDTISDLWKPDYKRKPFLMKVGEP